MKKLFILFTIFCITIINTFNTFAELTLYSDPYQSNQFDNYVTEYNYTTIKTPATILIDNISIQGGPIFLMNGSKATIVLNNGQKQLYNRIKFHYKIINQLASNIDSLDIKLNSLPIAQEIFKAPLLEDDYYVWVYNAGNIDLEFHSLSFTKPSNSVMIITDIQVYNS